MSVFPITFSIPEEKIVDVIPIKTKYQSSLIPGQIDTYIYQNEKDYYDQYKDSMFAITTKKAGWDCMRHYEILANGCIPYFPDIENCPSNTMALLPKELLIKANSLYKNNPILTSDSEEYISLSNQLLDYTKNHLTTEKMAKYILTKTNHASVSTILYLSRDTGPDYLRCVTLHGFKKIFGKDCHDYPMIPHLYQIKNMNYGSLYGKGITYTNLLDTDLHSNEFDKTIESDIKNKKYDIIIYGSYHRGMPYYDLVMSCYDPKNVILLCGEDIHNCDYIHWANRGHCVFVREL